MMTVLSLVLVIVVAATYGRRRGGYTEFPFLMAVIIGIWLIPQIWQTERDGLLGEGLNSFVVFVLLCMLATVAGYRLGGGSRLRQPLPATGPEDVLITLWPLIVLTLVCYLVQAAMFSLPSDQLMQRTPTGALSILKFFAEMRSVALAFSALLFFRYRTPLLLLLLLANMAVYLPSLFLEFKRTKFLTVGFIVVVSYWFSMRREFSRTILIMMAPVLLLLVAGVTELRQLSGLRVNSDNRIEVDLPTFSEVAAIDWAGIVTGEGQHGEKNTAIELQNAIHYKNAIDRALEFTFGAQYWNRLVQLYVPGSLIGAETKQWFMIGKDLYAFDFLSDYDRMLGSTLTGFLQAYADFSYMGLVVYLLCGFIMGRLFRNASGGHILYQSIYASVTIVSLNIFTHDSYRLLVYLPWIWFVAACVHRYSFRKIAARPGMAAAGLRDPYRVGGT